LRYDALGNNSRPPIEQVQSNTERERHQSNEADRGSGLAVFGSENGDAAQFVSVLRRV